MAALLKHWREAATLIVVCRTTPRPVSVTSTLQQPHNNHKLKTAFDYKLLFLKRSGKSKFMPSNYVFPGGTASDEDFSSRWADLFKKSGADLSEWPKLSSSGLKNLEDISPMLTRQRDPEFSAIPADISFRICAIRETFEESGLLLVRDASSPKLDEALKNFSMKLPVSASLCAKLTEEELFSWRKKVENDASEFLHLCETHGFVPDIWSLYDWSNWLTPVNTPLHALKPGANPPLRFDTAFYLSVVEEMPEFIIHDAGETVHLQWSTPAEMLKSFRAKELVIAPPQALELSRLIQFSSAHHLAEFAVNRADYHMSRWLPVRMKLKDAILSLFPGDCLYPRSPDLFGTEELLSKEVNLAELDDLSPKFRAVIIDRFSSSIQCDLDMSPDHITPLATSEVAAELDRLTLSANL